MHEAWHVCQGEGAGRGRDSECVLHCRVLWLTLLAPDIVEAILDGRQPDGMTLPRLMEPFEVEWDQQPSREHLSGARRFTPSIFAEGRS